MDCKVHPQRPQIRCMARKKLVGNLTDIAHLSFSLREFFACLDASRDRKRKKGIVFRTYVPFDFIVDDEAIILRLTRQKAIGFAGRPRRGTLEMKETIARLWLGKEEDLAKRLYRAR